MQDDSRQPRNELNAVSSYVTVYGHLIYPVQHFTVSANKLVLLKGKKVMATILHTHVRTTCTHTHAHTHTKAGIS